MPVACHVLSVDDRAVAKHVQNMFRSLRCFLDKSLCPHIDVDSSRNLTRPRCVRRVCFMAINTPRASTSSLLQNTLEICQALLSAMSFQTHDARQENSNFYTTAPFFFFFAHIFSFCSFLFFPKKRLATRSTFAPCLRFPRFRTCLNETSVGKIGAVGGSQHRKASAKLAPIVVLSVSDCCTLHVTPQLGHFVFSVAERKREVQRERKIERERKSVDCRERPKMSSTER